MLRAGLLSLAALATLGACAGEPTGPGGGGSAPTTPECAALPTCEACLAALDGRCGWCSGVCAGGDASGPQVTPTLPYCTSWVHDAARCDRVGGGTRAELRARGVFTAGDLPEITLDDAAAARSKIRQVIVVVQENHSFDNLFGHTRLADVDSVAHPRGALPWWSAQPFRLATSCPSDQPHQWGAMHAEWALGTLIGMPLEGGSTMGFYTDDDHPFYTSLAAGFGFSDTYFGSALGGTWANRNYLYLATSAGIKNTGQLPFPTSRSIFDAMEAAGVSFAYATRNPEPTTGDGVTGIAEGTLGPRFKPGGVDFGHLRTFESFLASVDAFDPVHGDPIVWFVDGGPGFDEHPDNRHGDSFHLGESIVREVLVDHVMKSAGWPATAVFVTYDESGGYFDHVRPPSAAPPDPTQAAFSYLGFRVPLFVVSPWAVRAVSHEVHSHTSLTRFIEALFNLPALTARDANSDALLDMFDFSGARAVGAALPHLAPAWLGLPCGVSPSPP